MVNCLEVSAGIGTALLSAASCQFYAQNTIVNNMNNSFMQIVDLADGLEDKVHSKGTSIISLGSAGLIIDHNNAANSKCAGGIRDTFKLTQVLPGTSPDVEGLRSQVMDLFNNATSSAWNIIRGFDFHATMGPLENGGVDVSFLICRQDPEIITNLKYRAFSISMQIGKLGASLAETFSATMESIKTLFSQFVEQAI